MTPLDRLIRDDPDLARPVFGVLRANPHETWTAGWTVQTLAQAAGVPYDFADRMLRAMTGAGLTRKTAVKGAPRTVGAPRRAYVLVGDIPYVPAPDAQRAAVGRIVDAFSSGNRIAMLAVLQALRQGVPAKPVPLATATGLSTRAAAAALDKLNAADLLYGPLDNLKLAHSALKHLPEACTVLGMEVLGV